uniref:Uncharacterized protein n=1 Tax=Sus scrofa TaxID=9823 RepID=A0A8D0RT48_PIG
MATASPAADGGRGRPWEGGLVSWPPAPPLTLPWTWMGPSWGQHPGHWGFPALTEPSASPAASLGIFEVRRVLDTSGCSMLAPLQTGAARFSSYLLSRARKVLGSHLFSPCGVPEFCSISTRKLAAHGFGASMAAMVSFPPQRYHYFLVLDFEVTVASLLQKRWGGQGGRERRLAFWNPKDLSHVSLAFGYSSGVPPFEAGPDSGMPGKVYLRGLTQWAHRFSLVSAFGNQNISFCSMLTLPFPFPPSFSCGCCMFF